MAIGKGGSSQSQNQNSTTTSSGTTSSTATPIAPEGWEDQWRAITGALGQQGLTPDQQTAADYFKGQVNSPTSAATNPALATINTDWLQKYTSQATPTLGAAPTVTAQTGASFAQPYMNTATSDLVDASLADLENKYQGTLAGSGLQSAAAGAFGGSRQGVREAQIADDYLRNAASTSATTRFNAFNAANQFGAQDASNALSASMTNAGIQNQRDMANQQAEFVNRQGQLGALDRIINNVNTYQGNINGVQNRQDQSAQTLFNTGGSGLSQSIQALVAGTPLFGQQNDGTISGTSNTVGTGSASGKNGGISICWVAREVYGLDGPWMDFRSWLLNEAPKWLLRLYTARGEKFAAFIQDKPRVKRVVKFFMDMVI